MNYLSTDELFEMRDALDNNFYKQKLEKEFPNKIIEINNPDINYWVNIYLQFKNRINVLVKHITQLSLDNMREYPTPDRLLQLGKNFQDIGQEWKDIERKMTKIYKYIEEKRNKSWPKIKNQEKEMQEFDILYRGGGFYIIKIDGKISQLSAININNFPCQFRPGAELKDILSYIYLQDFSNIIY